MCNNILSLFIHSNVCMLNRFWSILSMFALKYTDGKKR